MCSLQKKTWFIKGSSPSMVWMKYHSHKRTLWMEEPKSNLKYKKEQPGKTHQTKVLKHQKNAKGMGMRNKQIYLSYSCYNPVVSRTKVTKCRGKWISYIGIGRDIETLKAWFPYPSRQKSMTSSESYISWKSGWLNNCLKKI